MNNETERPTWEQIFPPLTNGFFTALRGEIGDLYPEYFDDETVLNILITQIGYGRRIGVFWDMFKYAHEVPLPAVIAAGVFAVYNKSWQRLYTALTSEYNPINNYKMQESGTDTRGNKGTQSTTTTHEYSDTETPDLTRTSNGTNDSSGGLYGFNSAESVPSDTTAGKSSSTDKQSGTVSRTGNEGTSNTRTDNLTETTEHTFTREGNIGVTTSQQMIESEIELRKKQFYNIVFKDIINYACLHIY